MHIYLRGTGLQRLRLLSGLILFVFAATHFANHAIGIISLEAMHAVQDMRTAVTRSTPVSLMLIAALVIHMALGLVKLASRKTWRMTWWEALQIGLGLTIPLLLLPHIVNTRIAHMIFGVNDIYLYELLRLWPSSAVLQSVLLIIVWTHACIGLHFWLRLSRPYKTLAPILAWCAVALPVLALAGFAIAGMQTADIMSDPDALGALKARAHWPDAAANAQLSVLRDAVRLGFAATLAIVLTLFGLRQFRQRSTAARITYAAGASVTFKPGMTLLEISRAAGVPHASVCGGRGRCSTCRVRITQGLLSLPPPTGAEAITLQSVEAPPNVRLACQIRPIGPLDLEIVSHHRVTGPVETEFSEIKEVVAAHVRAILAGQLVEQATDDTGKLAAWLGEKRLSAVAIPDLSREGFQLVGGRLDYLHDRAAAAIVYRHEGRAITVLALPRTGGTSHAVRGQRSGYHVQSWEDAAFDYFAVCEGTPEILDVLQGSWGPAIPLESLADIDDLSVFRTGAIA